MKPVSIHQPLKHYQWGNDCDGWNLVDETALSVKQEKMPAGTAEALHYHEYARQFFFMLRGEAIFEIEGERQKLAIREGLQIEPGKKHRIINESAEAIEFILCSQPSTVGDRINL